MTSAIANILLDRIGELPWMERYTGLVTTAVMPKKKADSLGNLTKSSETQTYAVACDVEAEKCWETDIYKYLFPDNTVKSVAFFTDAGGTVSATVTGPKKNTLNFTFDLKFLCWMNLKRLGIEGCNASALAVPEIIARIFGLKDTPAGPYNGIYQNVEVLRVRELVKSPSIFEPFFFAKEGERRGLFLYPYDYFGLQISGSFSFCLPNVPELEIVETEEYCVQP